MGLKFLNSELQMLWVMNCKKINKCIGNQQCNRHLYFPGQHYSFPGLFQTFPYLWSFSWLFKALKISTLNSRTFHTFHTNPDKCNLHLQNINPLSTTATGGIYKGGRGKLYAHHLNSCFNIWMCKALLACVGQLVKRPHHHQQLKLHNTQQFRLNMHQNASGSRALSGPAGRAQTLP